MPREFHIIDPGGLLADDLEKRLRLFRETADLVLDHTRQVCLRIQKRVERVLEKYQVETETKRLSQLM